MKPKSKKQERIVALSKQLRPLTPAQLRWALNSTINHYAFRLKGGKAVCMTCGHEFTTDEDKCRCPHCQRMLAVKDTKQRVLKSRSYFNVITASAEYQVVRMFMLFVEFRKGYEAKPGYVEVGQYWLAPNGKKTVIGLQRTLGYFIDSFAFGSPLELRKDNKAFERIADEWVYPRIKATDTLKRNGFKGYCHRINPVTLFTQLLTNPKAETLMKADEVELLRYLCHYPNEVARYWETIKVARRAGYKIEDSQTWFDYIRMLERTGKDLHNAKLVAPLDLIAAHDEYVAKIERQRLKEQSEKNRQQAATEQARFEELKSRYFGLEMSDGEINLHSVDTIDEYYEIGNRQHICVASSKYYLKENSLVLTAYIGKVQIATIEISLKDYRVLQCRAFANGVCEYTDRIEKIIRDNAVLIAKRKTA